MELPKTQRNMRSSLLFVISLFVLSSCKEEKTTVESSITFRHPNVLFIAVDDLNNMLGILEKYPAAKTPNIDRLASKGVIFSDAHCQTPLCGPSRASLMTGLRPSTTGIYGMIPDDKIRSEANPATKDIVFLPEYFKKNGYHTMASVNYSTITHPKVFSMNREVGPKDLDLYPKNVLSGMVSVLPIVSIMVEPVPIGALFRKQIH